MKFDRSSWNRDWVFGLLLVAATLTTYLPAWNGKPIWDDDRHLTRPELRSVEGLYRIWTQPSSTAQYYPLVHTVFWVEHKLWGDLTPGYHLVNILLHAFSALLLLKILRRLEVPGAWLAAAIFALHPVQVESVAWMSELKNTLSGVFYFGSALAYLKFDRTRNGRLYAIALGLFILGLLSKTVIATLPAALLVVFWWERGRLFWKRDARPLVPFFLTGITAGLFTAWLERKFIGAEGRTFDFTVIERFLIAGRAFWFYLGKLFWPAHLVFIYPRWNVSGAVWWQYLFPAAALLLLAAAWALRGRWRGPLAGLLFFAGTLFPALGFFNVYPFRFSFVADHFQYLAGVGVITLASAGAARLLGRWRLWGRPGGNVLCLTLLAILTCLTWRQCGTYADIETLWRNTLVKNPDCWLARNNLGVTLADKGRLDEAIENYHKAIQIDPNSADTLNNLGFALAAKGRFDEAIENYYKAIQIKPNYTDALNNLGLALVAKGRFDEAIENYRKAIQIDPNSAITLNNLGVALAAKGRFDEAIENFRKTIQIDPNPADALNNLGFALAAKGRFDEAIENYRKAIQINPNSAPALDNLGFALAAKGRFDEAIGDFRKAIQINPNSAPALDNLGMALAARGRFDEAIENYYKAIRINSNRPETFFHLGMALGQLGRTREAVTQYREALGLNPNLAGALNDLAWILATSPTAEFRDGTQAVQLAERACELTHYGQPLFIGTLAAAYAEAGRFSEAVETAKRALDLSVAQNNKPLAVAIQARLKLYETNVPYHEKP
jgi:tetratricopeptide (TPR) repeat protein